MGSPPPTRGTPPQATNIFKTFGITPAYAGNTQLYFYKFGSYKDHPRLRGEHPFMISANFRNVGSPPPTRGTRDLRLLYECYEGITPAYAGNTTMLKGQKSRYRDHPRLRGEHLYSSVSRLCSPGSPPPTRGTLIRTMFNDKTLRITPAYAGNTSPVTQPTQTRGDHPRLRGEHSNKIP